MFSRMGYSIRSIVLGGAMLAAGCASSGAKDGSAGAAGGGMMCPTCKTVWTFDTIGQGSKVQRLAARSGMTCPECDTMAAAYLKDGQKVLHNCDTCRVAPTVLQPMRPRTHLKGTH